MNRTDPGDAPTFQVVSLRHVRAGDDAQAREIQEEEIRTQRSVDTGEAGHIAGGRVVSVLSAPRNTVNGALQEAAILLFEASEQEGDDGTGGSFTRDLIAKAVRLADEASYNLQ